MTLHFALTILLWTIWGLIIGVPLLLFIVCAWVLHTHKSEQIQVLSSLECPHCGGEFGRTTAKHAVNGRDDPAPPPSDGTRRGYHVAERHVVCSRCDEVSFWYPATLKLSATSNFAIGVPESLRPLPDWLKDDSDSEQSEPVS